VVFISDVKACGSNPHSHGIAGLERAPNDATDLFLLHFQRVLGSELGCAKHLARKQNMESPETERSQGRIW